MLGKVPPDRLREVILSRSGASDPAVTHRGAYGEDAAAIDLGTETLVVSADPISLAAADIGQLGVVVACNDVAASGARPRWLTNTMFLPDDDPGLLDRVTRQLDETAAQLDVAIVGGHTEYDDSRDRPLLALTAFGLTESFVPTGGAVPGDAVVLVGTAGIEGTAILARDFRSELLNAGVGTPAIEQAETFLDELSVVEPAISVANLATGMHDPTEGGVLAACVEMAAASETTIEIDSERIPVRDATITLAEAMDVDPLAMFGSGALLVTCPDDAVEEIAARCPQSSVERIGRVVAGPPRCVLPDAEWVDPPREELYGLWA